MKSFAFRVWFPFALFSGLMLLIIAFYYSNKQEELYIKNRRFELQELAKSVALAVELSLQNENLEGLKKALELAKSTDDFEKVAVVIKDEKGNKKQLFANPEKSNVDVLSLDSGKFILERYAFKTDLLSGEIYMVSSKAKINKVIFGLNAPLYQILLFTLILSVIVFYWFAKRSVKPIQQLINYSKSIEENDKFDLDLGTSTTTEIKNLGQALHSLSSSLNLERKRNDDLLQDLENKVISRTKENNQLSLVAKHALNGVLIADKNKRIVWANQSLLNITGYSLEEILRQSPKMFQFEGTDVETINRINQALKNNEIVKEQVLNRGKNGKEYWLDLNIVPVFEENEVTGYIAVETDITERIIDDNLLRKSEELNRRILENSSEMIHTLDNFGNLVWANKSWFANMGLNEDEIKGKSIVEFLDENTRIEFENVTPILLKGESVNNLECVFITKSNDKIQLRGKTIPLIENGKIIGSQAYLHNVTQIIDARDIIRKKSLLQDLIMRISTKYINFPIEHLDQTILDSLGDIANFVEADRAYIFDYYLDKGYCEYKYEWTAPGIRAQINDYKTIQLDTMPYWLNTHKNKEFVIVETSAHIEDENIRQLLVTEGIKSLITIPIHDEDRLVGFVGFDLIKIHRIFSDEEKEILVLFSQMLVNVYKRLTFIKELNNSKKEVESINSSLEQRVAENTKKNLDLSKSMLEQEKMATIGEISAGIAHDLNTPLGTIKVGADNVRFMIGSILSNDLSALDKADFDIIHERIDTSQPEMFVGGLQLRKEKSELINFISQAHSNFSPSEIEKLADLIVKSRVKVSETELINRILDSKNPLLFADLLYQIQMATTQLETIKKSTDKAVKVVQDVRSFMKGEASKNERRKFNVRDNISTVLGIFNYELRKNVDLKFEVDATLEMEGFDVKLFQLWSNLIKNAFEAMEEQPYKYIGIYSAVENGKIHLTFENNGPKIPDELKATMFNKFFTTKSKKSGSGLGLSIVKNVLADHNASIDVISTEQLTKFIVTFII